MIGFIMKLTGASKAMTIGGLVLLVVMGLGAAKCSYDRALIKDHDQRIERKLIEKNAEAREAAADRRVEDAQSIETEKEIRDAEIDKAPVVRPDDGRIRLNCERLRRAGHDTSRIAPCAGLDGSAKAADPS